MIKEAIIAITAICFITAIGSVVGSASNKSVNEINTTDMERYVWYNGGREEQVFAALDEIAVFPKNVSEITNVTELIRSFDQQATLIKDYESIVLARFPNQLNRTALEDKIAEFHNKTGNRANFVFYIGPKKDQAPRALTGGIIVQFKQDWNETKIAGWARDMGITMVEKSTFSPNTYLFDAGPGLRSLEIANQIYLSGQVNYAYPNWWKTMSLRDDAGIQTDQEIPKEPTASLPETTTMETPKEVPFISNFMVVILILLIFYAYRRKQE